MQRLYLDTTVPSAHVDDRAPERQRLTQEFWREGMAAFDPVVSSLVLGEIRDKPDEGKRRQIEALIEAFPVLGITAEAQALAEQYVARGAIRDKFRDDALHVGIAVVHQVPLMASWNFKHLVRVQVRREINLINALLDYGQIEIVSPPEL